MVRESEKDFDERTRRDGKRTRGTSDKVEACTIGERILPSRDWIISLFVGDDRDKTHRRSTLRNRQRRWHFGTFLTQLKLVSCGGRRIRSHKRFAELPVST